MTAFGHAGDDRMEWRIKAVNHRYLELAFRLPDPLKAIEPALRERLGRHVRRGRVEATLRVSELVPTQLDEAALAHLLQTVARVRERLDGATVDVLELLRWPGIAREDSAQLAALTASATEKFDAAVEALVAHRQQEGAALATVLERLLRQIETHAAAARCRSAGDAAARFERLQAQAAALTSAPPSAERFEQELALLVQKSDVTEELDRIDVHLAAATASLRGSEPCGRRLDFLLQELGREANTLAAKSVAPEAASLAVELKVAVEQMREQVQNVE